MRTILNKDRQTGRDRLGAVSGTVRTGDGDGPTHAQVPKGPPTHVKRNDS